MGREGARDAGDLEHAIILTNWSGPDDVGNPRNFSLQRRTASTLAVTLLAFVSTLAASIYSPAHDDVSKEFNVSAEVAILPLALYNFGLAFG
jgi:MFS transporter, DHA1 family, multidrug resistance protein